MLKDMTLAWTGGSIVSECQLVIWNELKFLVVKWTMKYIETYEDAYNLYSSSTNFWQQISSSCEKIVPLCINTESLPVSISSSRQILHVSWTHIL